VSVSIYLQHVDDNSMKHMIQTIVLKHRQVAIVMLCPAGLCLQQLYINHYLYSTTSQTE